MRVTTRDLKDKKVCTYMEMLKALTDKVNEIIEVVNLQQIPYQHTIELHCEPQDQNNFTLCFTFRSYKEDRYTTMEQLIADFSADGVMFTASGKVVVSGNTYNIGYIIIDDVDLTIGYIDEDSIGDAFNSINYSYEDIERDVYVYDSVNIL